MKKIFLSIFGFLTIGILLYGLNYYRISQPTRSVSEYFEDPQVQKLVLATAKGDISAMDRAVAAGADVNAIGKENMTPLLWSFGMFKAPHQERASYQNGFQYLLNLGADPVIPENEYDRTMLSVSAMYPNSFFLKAILQADIDIDFIHDDYHRPTATRTAIFADQFENFKILIDAGADVDFAYTDDRPLINFTTINNRWEFCYYLLQKGADYSLKGKDVEQISIVRSLESFRYSPPTDGRIDYREKVIEFLRNEGIEVNPWYPEGYQASN